MYINRELSWLAFNQRVLNQAQRKDLPLLERVRFLAISASNLDEFFQVRVGGLQLMIQEGIATPDRAGYTPAEQLELVRRRSIEMVQAQYDLVRHELLPLLQAEGLAPVRLDKLGETQQAALEQYFIDNIAPLLTPLALEDEAAPLLPSLSLHLGIELQQEEAPGETRFVAVTLPDALPRRVHSSALSQDQYVLIEDVAAAFIGHFFPGEEVVNVHPFRVTRNGDIAVAEEEGGNFAHDMEEVLVARKFSACVRLEIPARTPEAFATRLASIISAQPDTIYRVPGPLRLVDFSALVADAGHEHLKISTWEPNMPAGVDPGLSMFENIAEGDILIHNPYENYEPVVKLVEEAAADPDVLAIKQCLYRTCAHSRFITALCRAAEAGKQVTVLVELKARFDEGRNLHQAELLQRAGVQVVYGVKGFKTHAKVLLIVRRENGILRRYCHFGTGNYNENTARIYSDISLLTCDENLGADASQFFNSITGRTKLMRFRRLHPSPALMKEKLLSLIQAETRRARQNERAEIRAKMNSLNDADMIRALDEAAEAGVRISLNIRGICCWLPGSQAARERVTIVSIVDRYLEHARIFSFHNGGTPKIYIGSADWMGRNLDRRVELMIPIENAMLAHRVSGILDACFKDNVQAYHMQADGSYCEANHGTTPFRMQQHLQRQAELNARAQERANRQTLEPHLPR
ncbi:MAG: polyphosphate kinase 1 [Akkermansia sp.]|nr:polyphosphate kinase 1 [Akkermansia sp.]